MKQEPETLDSFDKESFKAQFEKVIPQILAEMGDLLERPTPRVTKRDRQEMSDDISWGLDVSIPHLKALEKISGDLGKIDEGYRIMEELLRTYLRRAKARLRPGEDAFDYFLRKSAELLRSPYPLRRLRQYRIVREGVDRLVHAALSSPGGMDGAKKLIEEFGRKHLKEYMRFANAIDGRLSSYRNIDLKRMTPQNVTRLTDVYRDSAAAFEKRLRLLVGLNFIAGGKTKTYAELRGRGYNELLQAVESPDNPLLHFLKDVINRNVRNAMMHGGVSSSRSKGTITFVDYSPGRKKETEVVWTMSEFFRRTRNLFLTILAVTYLEQVFTYWQLYGTIAVLHHLRTNPK
jgi:hypothetical protein